MSGVVVDPAGELGKLAQQCNLVYRWLMAILLVICFILLAAGANESVGFAQLIYGDNVEWAASFMGLFGGHFTYPGSAGTMSIEFELLVAIVVYAIIFFFFFFFFCFFFFFFFFFLFLLLSFFFLSLSPWPDKKGQRRESALALLIATWLKTKVWSGDFIAVDSSVGAVGAQGKLCELGQNPTYDCVYHDSDQRLNSMTPVPAEPGYVKCPPNRPIKGATIQPVSPYINCAKPTLSFAPAARRIKRMTSKMAMRPTINQITLLSQFTEAAFSPAGSTTVSATLRCITRSGRLRGGGLHCRACSRGHTRDHARGSNAWSARYGFLRFATTTFSSLRIT